MTQMETIAAPRPLIVGMADVKVTDRPDESLITYALGSCLGIVVHDAVAHVDDSAVMRTMIRRTLSLCGLALGEVYEAANGVEALDRLGEHWVDLALLDVNMPVMDGEELLIRIRESEEWRALAENMLGASAAPDVQLQRDALGELANVVTGNA